MQTNERDLDPLLAQCKALLEQIDDMLDVEPMTPEEVRHAAKLPRDGGDGIVSDVAAQCIALDFTRAGPDVTVTEMLQQLERARALRGVLMKEELVRAKLRAARVKAESESWRAAMTFYAVLRRTAAKDPSVHAGLEPVRRFFRLRGARRRRFESGVELARKRSG